MFAYTLGGIKMRIVFVTNRVKNYALGFRLIIELLMELGHEVIWAADFSNFKGDKTEIPCEIYQTDFRSNPLNMRNIKAYKQLINLFKTRNVDAIHCNTPIGGFLGRICANRAGIKKVIYTAHGFHFYKGAPFLNRTLFKWGEKLLAHYTDVLVTINDEDYEAARGFNLRNKGELCKIHGAGIETGYLTTVDIEIKRNEIGVPNNAIMIFSAGELNKNKNNEVIIRAIAKLKDPNIYYVICGEGVQREKLEQLSKDLKISNRVLFLGFRTDVLELLPAADIFAMTSYREGLPRSLMEAMDAGLPCIVSKIRGNCDLIKEGKGGYLCSPDDVNSFTNNIKKLATDKKLRKQFGETNKKLVRAFDINNVKDEMRNIYINTFLSK